MSYKNIIKSKNRIAIGVLSIGVFLFFGVNVAEAASISLRPSTQSASVGNIVSVRVVVNTDGKYINNSDGTIQYPTELLDVLSVSKSGSIFSLWVEEPRFSNLDGTISFNGGVPNPGFYGSNGEVISITFKAKKSGNASLIFNSASVRENDGLGTDILTSKQSATIQVLDAKQETPVPVVETPPPAAKSALPVKPSIVSATHPKQDVWYQGGTASFSWNVAQNITSIQASLNKTAMNVPTVSYDGSVSRKTLNDLADGVYYFNLRQKNSFGWSTTAQYKIQVDNTPPEDFTPVVKEVDLRNVVVLEAEDETSGVNHYVLKVDSDEEVRLNAKDLENAEYLLHLQSKGAHVLTAVAYDKAGNTKEAKVSFVSPEIVLPKIALSSENIEVGEGVIVTGTSVYKKARVQVVVQFANDEIKKYNETTTDEGAFKVAVDNVTSKGTASVVANMLLGDNGSTNSNEKLYFNVGDPKSIQNVTKILYPAFGIVLLVFITMALIFIMYLGWHKFLGLRRRYRKDLNEMTENIHKTMLVFKKELNGQLKTLQDIKKERDLNEREEKIFDDIQNNIDDVEKFIQKKIKKLL